jgi:NAD(P)-dependent dehydrogenase (short-subunit alcohol dehydrogenase family)
MDDQVGPLAGMNALVTGGGSSIGLASARWLVRDGAAVTIVGRDVAKLQRAAHELRALRAGADVRWVRADVTDADDVRQAVEIATEAPGRLQICVTSAGGNDVMAPLLMQDAHTFAAAFELNVVGTFLPLKYAAAEMAQHGGGSFVAISSHSAKLNFHHLAPYCVAKSALETLVRVAADELGHLGVRVNAVRPGLVRREADSPIFGNDELMGRYLEQNPIGRLGVGDDIAAAVRYFAGPESSWVTGQSFAIDGGNELRRAPSLEPIARRVWGDDAIDAALQGRLAE